MRYLKWIDVSKLSFNTLLLLERVQLRWLPGWVPEGDMAIALRANPVVEWYLRHKCPEISSWVDGVMAGESPHGEREENDGRIRQSEEEILNTINDLVVYAVDPAVYDALPFNAWDSDELRLLVDWHGKTVIDVGSGTGRQAFVVAETGAHAVFAVEPVGNLRRYIKQKAQERGLRNVFTVDGLITDLPFPDGFADVTIGGHVFGGDPPAEYAELKRVTRLGGMVILCPGSSSTEMAAHEFLVERGFAWSWFEEPEYGRKRKYWMVNG
jgi:SAM-dependent methyltransferase